MGAWESSPEEDAIFEAPEPPPALVRALKKVDGFKRGTIPKLVTEEATQGAGSGAKAGVSCGSDRHGDALMPMEPDQGFGRKAFITPPEGGEFLLTGALQGQKLTLATSGGSPVMTLVFACEAGSSGVLFRTYDGRPLAFLSLEKTDEGIFHLYTHSRPEEDRGGRQERVVAVLRSNLKASSVCIHATTHDDSPMGVLHMDPSCRDGTVLGRSGELLATYALSKPAPPVSLFVGMPEALSKYNDEYTLAGRKGKDSMPAWKSSYSSRWLYSGGDGRWYLADGDAEKRKFCCSVGVARTVTGHRGVWPNLWEGPWERLEDQRGGSGGWVRDSTIVVASTRFAQQALSTAREEEAGQGGGPRAYRYGTPSHTPNLSKLSRLDEGPCRVIRTAPGVDIGVAVSCMLPIMTVMAGKANVGEAAF